MTATPGLDAWAARQESRCACGFDVATQGCHCTGDEWAVFIAALRSSVSADGLIHQSDMRPKIRGRIAPRHIGAFYRRAKSEGLIADTGEREQSDDLAGRNTDKLDRLYRLVGANTQRSAA